MRRRRNADAPSDETQVNPDPLNSDSQTNPDAANAAPEPTAETAPRRRRTPARRKDETVPSVEAENIPAPVEAVETPAPPEKPKRAPRRRTAVKSAASEPDAETPAENTLPETEAVPEVPASSVEIVAAPEILGESEPSEVGMTRAPVPDETGFSGEIGTLPTGIDQAADAEYHENLPEATSDTEAIPVSEEMPDEAEGEPAEGEEGEGSAESGNGQNRRRNRSRRRRGRRGETAETATGEATLSDPVPTPADLIAPTPPPTAPAASVTVPTAAQPVPAANGDNRRTRGLRRQAAGEAAKNEAGEGEASSASADDLVRRRVRGVRRQVVGRVLGKPSSANVAVTTAETTPATSPAAAAPKATETTPPRYQPLPVETLARLAEARVERIAGMPELIINGEPRPALWFFVNTVTSEAENAREIAARQIRMAYDAGVRFFTALAHLPWRTKSGERRYDPLDDTLTLIAENAPEAFILPRLIFSPPASWERAHPDEMTRYNDDETGDVSLASREFWETEAEAAVRAAVERVAQGPYASRVFGFYLEHAEWFYEKGRSYDYSVANQQGFRDWLKYRYKSSVVTLRAAWNDGEVTFDKAEVPAFPPPAGATLFFGPREQRYADYHEYASDLVAQVITDLGHAIKEASGKRSLVAVSYGYTLEMPRAASGHLSLAQVLASPDIDILTGPISYSARMPGGSAPLPVPIDSVHLAGKLWVSEDDTKSYLASRGDETPDSYNPVVTSLEATAAVYARNFGAALTHGAGVSWMDLWGQGWLDDRELWEYVGHLQSVAETTLALRREGATPPPIPDVAVLVDERSFFGVRSDESLLGALVSDQRDTLLRSGARIGFYLLSDLLNPKFPKAKLLLFLNAFRLPDAVRTVLRERFQKEGRTFAWLYGPGAGEANPFEVADAVGISLKLQPWGSKTGTQILSGARSPLTDSLRGQRVGEERRVNPSFYVNDQKAEVLGEYTGTSYPSLAVRRHGDWQSVFFGETTLPLAILRGLYQSAGVPVYTVDDDVAWIGDHLICLHSAPGGGTTVFLPESGALADVLTGEALASGGNGVRLSIPPRGTRLLFYGTPEQVARFGIDVRGATAGLASSEIPVTAPTVTGYSGANNTTSDVSAEDDALMAAVLAGVAPIRDKDTGDENDDEDFTALPEEIVDAGAITEVGPISDADKKKRRRRRRGRGPRSEESGEDTMEIEAEGTVDIFFEEVTEEESITVEDLTPLGTPVVSVPEAVPIVGRERRPSLEELLPLSESPSDGDLPPIPDEFLPLDTAALADVELFPEDSARSRRRARPPRRSRRLSEPETLVSQEGLTTDPIVELFSENTDEAPVGDAAAETAPGEMAFLSIGEEADVVEPTTPVDGIPTEEADLPVPEPTTEMTDSEASDGAPSAE